MAKAKAAGTKAKAAGAKPVGASSRGGSSGIKVTQKSPAEFFAENQNIAGFDNPGKALYTTVRELVENSLDAAESINVLPDISLTIEELCDADFEAMRGVDKGARADTDLYVDSNATKKKKPRAPKSGATADEQDHLDGASAIDDAGGDKSGADGGQGKAGRGGRSGERYFKLTCVDNGCGMKHKDVPELFGRVLSGSKYTVKQARGKFGLGAKMALIWSRKSTGLPIEITTAHTTRADSSPSEQTYCKLDIDIHKNEPRLHQHVKQPNATGWHGTRVELVISGNWTNYQARVKQYLSQLAVITPYAQLQLQYVNRMEPKKAFTLEFERRSERMPSQPDEEKFHPKSVDNLIVRRLMGECKEGTTVLAFLSSKFQGVQATLARRLADELEQLTKGHVKGSSTLSEIPTPYVHELTQLLRETCQFSTPNSKVLRPAGEYNLHLGIMQVYKPTLVVTMSNRPTAGGAPAHYDGHAFAVEAAVAISPPDGKPGISVYRFANRIPLLFEPGADVVNVVVNKDIKWKTYFIDPKKDKVSVFVSIVSTKIPFKGTGKEYIGADIEPLRKHVQDVLKRCLTQIKKKRTESRHLNDRANRLKSLERYVPNVSAAFFKVVEQMREKLEEEPAAKRARTDSEDARAPPEASASETVLRNSERRQILAEIADLETTVLRGEKLTSSVLGERLQRTIQEADNDLFAQVQRSVGRGDAGIVGMFLLARRPVELDFGHPITNHPILAMRLLAKAEVSAPPAGFEISPPLARGSEVQPS